MLLPTSLGAQCAAGWLALPSTVHCSHTDPVLHSREQSIHCEEPCSVAHSGEFVLLLGVTGGGDWDSSERVVQDVPIGLVWGGVDDEGGVLLDSLGVDPDGGPSRNWVNEGSGGKVEEGGK